MKKHFIYWKKLTIGYAWLFFYIQSNKKKLTIGYAWLFFYIQSNKKKLIFEITDNPLNLASY
jgi:hypothetical protein